MAVLEKEADVDARSLVVARIIDAPRGLVFEAWTDPKRLEAWWGPNGFTTTTHAFDMRVGGVWRFVMHGPDGRDYQNRITFDEITPPERIRYHHGGGDDVEPVQFRTTVTFEDVGGKTRLTMRAVFASAAERDRVVREYGAEEGGKQTIARLAAYVVETLGAERTLVITRVFDAPRALVWRMWTEAEHAMRWSGPRDYPITKTAHDIRPGGKWRSCLRSVADGSEIWNGGTYREVVENERLVFTFAWDGDDAETLVTVEFSDQDGKTRMNFRQQFLASAESRDGHGGGWNSSFDRLDDHLAAITTEAQHEQA